MGLTTNQKHNLFVALIPFGVLGVIVLLCWGAVTLLSSQPAPVNTPPVPQVNATHFEQLDFGNGDPQLDHFCIGTTGFYINTSSGNMDQIVKDDSLCP